MRLLRLRRSWDGAGRCSRAAARLRTLVDSVRMVIAAGFALDVCQADEYSRFQVVPDLGGLSSTLVPCG